MVKNTSTTTSETLTEDRRRVQWIKDDNGGGSGSMTGPMDCKRQQSVDFTCYHVVNSNTVSYLYRRCLVLILFSSHFFPPPKER